jgi:hypothetical protein
MQTKLHLDNCSEFPDFPPGESWFASAGSYQGLRRDLRQPHWPMASMRQQIMANMVGRP